MAQKVAKTNTGRLFRPTQYIYVQFYSRSWRLRGVRVVRDGTHSRGAADGAGNQHARDRAGADWWGYGAGRGEEGTGDRVPQGHRPSGGTGAGGAGCRRRDLR
jgi:hypothetical protein